MSALRDQTARRRLDPLTTSVNAAPQLHGTPQATPNSAYSNNPLSAPFGYQSQSWTPVRQYNPQQWASPSNVNADHGLQYARQQRHDPDSKFKHESRSVAPG